MSDATPHTQTNVDYPFSKPQSLCNLLVAWELKVGWYLAAPTIVAWEPAFVIACKHQQSTETFFWQFVPANP